MKLHTSYFARSLNHPLAVSIAGRPWFARRDLLVIPELTPGGALVKDYKSGGISWEEYSRQYLAQLDELGGDKVRNLLSDGMVMLCWEGPGKHCHRHLLAEWIREKLGWEVSELLESTSGK